MNQMEQAIESQRESLKKSSEERARLEEQYLDMLNQLKDIQASRDESRKELESLRKSDEEYKSWSEGRLPDSVIERERLQYAPRDGDQG